MRSLEAIPCLAGDALDDVAGESSKTVTPLAAARATPSKELAAARFIPELTTYKKEQRLETLFATDEYVEVEVYQRMIAAYSEPNRERGRELT